MMMGVRMGVMAMAGLGLMACGGAGQRPIQRDTSGDRPGPLEPVLMRAAVDPTAEVVATRDELVAAARAARRNPIGSLDELTGLQWRGLTFDAAAVADIVAVRAAALFPEADRSEVPTRAAFAARYGIAHDEAWKLLMDGYGALMEHRFGIVADNVSANRDRAAAGHTLVLQVSGTLPEPDGSAGYAVRWTGGRFELSGASPNWKPRPAPAPARSDEVVETVVQIQGGYYAYPTLSWTQVRFRPNGKPAAGQFHGNVRRAYADEAEFVTSGGERVVKTVVTGRWTPYFTVKRGGVNPFGLSNDIHLVRATLDGEAQPGSAIMTEDMVVLDGTPEHPIDMSATYRDVLRRFDGARRGAELGLANDVDQLVAEFAVNSKAWAQQMSSQPGRLESSSRDFADIRPSFEWNAADRTLAIDMLYDKRVTFEDRYYMPNPALQNYSCPDGAPCAQPEREIAEGHDQVYRLTYRVRYLFDNTGALVSETADPARIARER